ncbi:MAG: hypothetical protein IV100_01655 [Myxococcales bacterium]|nr:hypothetical protein [Myxococcales bacterium]
MTRGKNPTFQWGKPLLWQLLMDDAEIQAAARARGTRTANIVSFAFGPYNDFVFGGLDTLGDTDVRAELVSTAELLQSTLLADCAAVALRLGPHRRAGPNFHAAVLAEATAPALASKVVAGDLMYVGIGKAQTPTSVVDAITRSSHHLVPAASYAFVRLLGRYRHRPRALPRALRAVPGIEDASSIALEHLGLKRCRQTALESVLAYARDADAYYARSVRALLSPRRPPDPAVQAIIRQVRERR